MPTEVEVAGEGIFEFPDGMGDDEIQSILRKQFPVQEPPQAKDFRRDELAKQTFQARLEGEQAKALTGLTDIGTEAAKAVVRAASHVDPTGFTQGLMQQYGVEPTHVIPPEVAHRGGEIVAEAAGEGLRKLGITHDIVPKQVQKPIREFAAENIAALPEMLPALITGATVAPRPIGRLFQAQMLRGVPESAYAAATAETPEERLKAGLGAGMGLAFPALIERGLRTPSVPIPDFIGRQLEMQRGAIPPRGEPVAPIERVTPDQSAVAAERMSAPFEGKGPEAFVEPSGLLEQHRASEITPKVEIPQLASKDLVLWGFKPGTSDMPVKLDKSSRKARERAGWILAEYAKGDEPTGLILQAKEAQPKFETITPAEDAPIGKNDAGEELYQRQNGQVYRMRHDRKDRPNGYPDFGGDLAPVTEPSIPAPNKPDVTPTVTEPAKPEVAATEVPKGEPVNLFESGKQYLLDNGERVVWLGRASPGKFDQYDVWRIRKIVDGKAQPEETVYGRNFHETKQNPFLSGKSQGELGYEYEQLKSQLAEQKQQTGNSGKVNRANTRARMKAIEEEQKLLEAERKRPTPKPAETPVEAAGRVEADLSKQLREADEFTSQAATLAEKATREWGVHVEDVVNPLKAQIRKIQSEVAQMEYDARRTKPETKGKSKLTKKAFLEQYGVASIEEANALYKSKNEAWAKLEKQLEEAEAKRKELEIAKERRGKEWSSAATRAGEIRRQVYPKVREGDVAQPIPQGPGDKLQALTAKLESGENLTASEKKQYLKLRDEATKKEPEAAQAQVSVGPGAAAPLDIAAESAAQSAGIRTAEYINRGLETKDIPTKPDIAVPESELKSADPQVEARWKAARLAKASPLEKAKQAITASKNAMTRHFRFLDPKTDGVVTDILRVHENDPLHAKFMASQVMRGITEGLKPKKYDVFSRIVILRDLVKYGEQFGQDLADLPFGYKSWDAVKNDLGRFEALGEKYPDIKESLRRRDEFMDALRYDLVARGLLNEKVKDFNEYFHHQVLQYMAMKEPFASTGSTDVRTHGKGWQKGRTGSAKDYNTSYLESEFEVISQSFAQMATQDTLKQLKAAADISDQLKIAAKDARESGQDVTWEQLIPEDHTIWQPEQGNHFYWANSITEKALDAYLKGQKQLTEADIKEVLAMGGKKEQWVIPKRLAKTLDDFKPPVDHTIEKAIGAGISQWKRWTLFNPMRNVIYELNNLSGDADIAFAVDPKIFKYAPQSAKEVADFVRAKKGASKEMSDLVRLGVIDSGFSVQELPDLKGNQFFRALEGKDPSLVQRYWENVLDFNRWREGILRLSSYKRAMELLQSGKKPYWTSKKSEMDSLYSDPNVTREQIAAKLAREAIGDYGNISYAGQWIRSKLIPFYSWMEINAPRYVRLMQNASKEEGGSLAGRVAGVAGKKAITQSAKLAMRMSAFYFLANLWNRSMFPDEDKELNSTRDQFHVILRRNADGSITSLRLQGAFSDALSWFGAQDLIKDVKDVQSGLTTPQEKAVEMAKAPVNKVAQGAWPIYKTLFEALVKKQTYPDVFNPRPIRDSKAHIARMVSLGSIYDYLAKHPQRPGTWTLKALATYTTDPGEAAYLTAKSIVADKLKEMNVERPGAEPTEKSNALYYWKQSIRYKNPKLEEYWRNRYFELGGKAQYLDTGLRNTSPYNGVSKANRGKFESLLSPAEQEIMRRADDWYRKVYIER